MRVVAGVIERDGLILIGQRPPGKSHALEWEFPGGKVEAGESPRAALARELREELAIHAQIGREMTRYRFTYRTRTPLELIFFAVDGFSGEPMNRAFAGDPLGAKEGQLADYSFLEGDHALIRTLQTD